MMRLAALLLWIVLLAVSNQANADSYGAGRLLCSKNKDYAVLQFTVRDRDGSAVWLPLPPISGGKRPSRPSQQEAGDSSCELPGGVFVEHEIGADAALPSGLCAATPPEWFYLWVGRKRVFNRKVFWTCDGQHIHSVVITKKLFRSACLPKKHRVHTPVT
jgi:hypothetical protein